MSRPAESWTADRVRALPDDGQRYELIDGALVVTPSPRGVHQVALLVLQRLIDRAITGSPLHILHSPADISLGEDEILQPDLFVYRTASGRHLLDWTDITGFELVIEVLSPATARYDRGLKRRRYGRAGVPEYWIVDLDGRVIERWRPGLDHPEVEAERLVWRPGEGVVLTMDVERFFAEVWGEIP
ncbi:MAG TPA: Uma2 family endonuclease [Gemmatimonadales bacterium]